MPDRREQIERAEERAVRELPTADFTMPRSAVWLSALAVLLIAGSIWLALTGGPDFQNEGQQQQTRREEGEPWVMEGASEEVYHRDGDPPEPAPEPGPEGQAEVALSRMDPATAAGILSRMDPEPAARTLALTPTWRVGAVFDELQPDTAAQVFQLLRRIDGRPREQLRGEAGDAAGAEEGAGAGDETGTGGDGEPGGAADGGAADGENGASPAGDDAEGAGNSGEQPPGGVPPEDTNQT